ncbi:MAG TPA: DUF433 domain-containing protein [Thermoanaerobaculia bacterium]|jgi:uncharacterized protein (DUF433 family)|nr:DUF433 domain-containing protein [Thermoanaerobaculia bacterium]
MAWNHSISIDSEIMHGTPCITGTRIPVSVVLDNLAADVSPERILAEYSTLALEDLTVAIAYAAELPRERIITLPA